MQTGDLRKLVMAVSSSTIIGHLLGQALSNPSASASGIVTAGGLNVGPNSSDGYDVAGGGPAAGDVLKVMVLGNDPNNCFFTYAAPGVNQAPVFGAPTPATAAGSTTGC